MSEINHDLFGAVDLAIVDKVLALIDNLQLCLNLNRKDLYRLTKGVAGGHFQTIFEGNHLESLRFAWID